MHPLTEFRSLSLHLSLDIYISIPLTGIILLLSDSSEILLPFYSSATSGPFFYPSPCMRLDEIFLFPSYSSSSSPSSCSSSSAGCLFVSYLTFKKGGVMTDEIKKKNNRAYQDNLS